MALIFCFLALSFALEAKVAMYQPVGSPVFSVRAAKAMPADGSDANSVSSHSVLRVDSHHAGFIFAILTAVLLLPAIVRLERRTGLTEVFVPAALPFSPHTALRAPPAP